MKNPFIYGEEVSGENFCNRQNEINEILIDISNGQNIIIFSPRRYGKTSLIKETLRKTRKRGILSFYIDLYPAITKEKFIEIYATGIASQIKGKFEKVIESLKTLIPSLTPKATINQDGSFNFEFSFEKKKSGYSLILDDLFRVIQQKAEKEKCNAVVVFDEFQEIANYGDEEIERKMRSVFQSHRNVSYIFMGSKRHIMDEIFNRKDRTFYRSGKHFLLHKIDKKEWRTFIKAKFERDSAKIDNEIIDLIITETENHPYYVQFLCNIIWELSLENKTINRDLVNKGIDTLLSRESSAYSNLWDSLTIRQKQVITAFTEKNDNKYFGREFITNNNIAASTVQKVILKLYESGIIEKENGGYIFSDIFFKKWVLKNMKITPSA